MPIPFTLKRRLLRKLSLENYITSNTFPLEKFETRIVLKKPY